MPDADCNPDRSTASTTARRQRGVDHHAPAPEAPTAERLLPALADGVTLLEVPADGGRRPLQALVLDHLLRQPGAAFWVDARGYVSPTALARLAPSRRLLDRIHLVRGFTAYKHHAALQSLPAKLTARLDEGTSTAEPDGCSATPAVLVAPAVDARYRAAETLGTEQARTLLARGLAGLVSCARRLDVPVLLTRASDDALGTVVARAADQRLRCRQTDLGPRFVGDGVETLAYPVGDGSHRQTTLAYWQRLLDHRATRSDVTAGAGMDAVPSPDTSPAPRAAGDSPLTPSPLHDAHRLDVGPGGR